MHYLRYSQAEQSQFRQCLLDESASIAISLKCPHCDTFLPVNQPGASTTNPFTQASSSAPILVQYTNEGGVQNDLDILPEITEEAYLESNPEARRAKAMHTMCLEGDTEGVMELLRDASDEGADIGELVRFQDPLADMKSALHIAVEADQESIVWLLLWLASALPTSDFPDPARATAEVMSINRLSSAPNADIRGLRDGQDLSAEDIAQRSGTMSRLLQAGCLRP